MLLHRWCHRFLSFLLLAALLIAMLPGTTSLADAPDDDPGNTGYEGWYYYIGDVVNAANGNLYVSTLDMSVKARGFDLAVERAYNSLLNTGNSPFGYGWTHNFNVCLDIAGNGDATFFDADGSKHLFTVNGDDFTAPPGVNKLLVKNGDDTYTLFVKDGTEYSFDTAGVLQKVTDKNGNCLTLTWTNGNLTQVSDDAGQAFTFTYTGSSIATITDALGRKISYTYANGNLSEVTDALGCKTKYFYNENHVLRSVINRNGVMLNFQYENGKVAEVSNSLFNSTTGLPENRVILYSILYGENTAVYTDSLGARTTVQLDTDGSPTLIVNGAQNTSCTTWDANRNRIAYRDPNMNAWAYEYDEYGNLKKEVNPLGGTTAWVWNTTKTADTFISLMASETDANGHQTVYTFDANGNLTQITNADNKVSTMTCDAVGNQTTVTDFNGNRTDYTRDAVGNLLMIEYPYYNYEQSATVTANKTFTWDAAGRLLSYTDGNGNITSYTWDANGNLLTETDPLGGVITNTYNAEGSLVKTVDQLGKTIQYSQTVGGRIDSITDAAGNKTTMVYDAAGNLLSQTDAGSGVSTMTSDLLGRTTSVTDAMGHTEHYTYDANGNVLSHQDRNGNTTVNTYDKLDRLITKTDPLNNVTAYEYDAVGNLVKETDANGNATTYAYDVLDRMTKHTDALGNETRFEYDNNGNVVAEIDPLDNRTEYVFDAADRAITMTDALNNIWKYAWDPEGNLIAEIDPANNVTGYTWDALNRLVATTNPLGKVSAISYDAAGNILSRTDALGNVSHYQYDALNRLVKETDPLGNAVSLACDAMGKVLSRTDEEGNSVNYTYDLAGQLLTQTDAAGGVTTFTYDANGNVTRMTNANGQATVYAYDTLNRPVSTTTPTGNTTFTTYDKVGNVASRTDAKGQKTDYTWDKVNRLTKTTYPDTSSVSYFYDANGNNTVTSSTGGASENTTNVYDKLNRIIATTVDYGAFEKTIQYTFNTIGKRATMTAPDGKVTTYTWDAAGQLVTINAADNITGYVYDDAGHRTQAIYANGTTAEYVYDAAERLVSLTNRKGETVIDSSTFTLDKAGNRLTMTDGNSQVTTYTYDKLYRLTGVTLPDATVSTYTYDAMGNRLTETVTGADPIVYTYDDDNRLTTKGAIIYEFDKNGNLVKRTDGAEVTAYAYDYENRLTGVTLPDNSTIAYGYAANFDRLSQTKSGVTAYYFYDIADILLEMDAAGTTLAGYMHGFYIDEPLMRDSAGVKTFYHLNDLGSVTALTDNTGAVIATSEYDVFGTVAGETGANDTLFRFAGRPYDTDTDFSFMRARYYSTETGRFITSDPWGQSLGELNPYTYAKNNPVTLTDPFGGRTYRRFEGKTYFSDEFDPACLDRAYKAYQDAYEKFQRESWKTQDDLNKKLNQLRNMARQKCDKAVMHAFISTFVGVVVGTVVGVVTANPVAGALAGTAASKAYDAIATDDGASLGTTDALSTAASLGNVFAGAIGSTYSLYMSCKGAEDSLDKAMRDINKLAGEWEKALQEFINGAQKLLPEVYHNYAEKNCKIRKVPSGTIPPVSTGRRNTPDRDGRITSGGSSVTGTKYDDLELRGKEYVDPEGDEDTIDIPTFITVTNRGTTATKAGDYKIDTALFSPPEDGEESDREILLVGDESNEHYKVYQTALTALKVNYETVLIDTEYCPVYSDQNDNTKDLKDYDVILWECGTDKDTVLEAPAQAELKTYLDNHGCLGVFGGGIMERWNAVPGNLMADYLFAGEMATYVYGAAQVNGVPGTLGERLSFTLNGYTNNKGFTSVKEGGEACFLASCQVAAIQADNQEDEYKTVLSSFTLEQLPTADEQLELMDAILKFLDCRYRHGGGGDKEPPPTEVPPLIPGETTKVPVTVTVTPGPHKAVYTLTPGDGNGSNNKVTTELFAKKKDTGTSGTKYTFDDPVTGAPVESGAKTEDYSPHSSTRTYMQPNPGIMGNTGNYWWCGLPSDVSYDYVSGATFVNPGGYGNNWWDTLVFPPVQIDPNQTVASVGYNIYHNTQLDHDKVFFDVFYWPTNTWQNIGSSNGNTVTWGTNGRSITSMYYSNFTPSSGGDSHSSIDLNNDRNAPQSSDPVCVRFRFRFQSDGSGSNEDGQYISPAAYAVDDIKVWSGADIVYKNSGGDDLDDVGDDPEGLGVATGDYWHLVQHNGSNKWAAFDPQTGKWPHHLTNFLTLPQMDISGMTEPTLYYEAEMDLPNTNNDFLQIQASKDGGQNWYSLYQFGQKSNDVQTVVPINLTNYKSSQFVLRFLADAWGATHTYGVYLDNIEIKDKSAAGGQTVPPQPPVAEFTAPAKGSVNSAVSFDASASTDADGAIVTYAWDFGDGATATGKTAAHTYTSPWIYPVTLLVTDNEGMTDSQRVEIPVSYPTAPAPQPPAPAPEPAPSPAPAPETEPQPGFTVMKTVDTTSKVTDNGTFKEEVVIETEDDEVKLVIGQGTIGLTANGTPISEVKVSKVDIDVLPEPPAEIAGNKNVILLAYDFDAGGATFDKPVTVTVSYDPAQLPEGADENQLVIAWYDEANGVWVELPTVVDPVTKKLTVQLYHFSKYALIAKVPVEPLAVTEEPVAEEPEVVDEEPAAEEPVVEPVVEEIPDAVEETVVPPVVEPAGGVAWWVWLIIGLAAAAGLWAFYRYWFKSRYLFH